MDLKEALEQIKTAELKAQDIVESANQQARLIFTGARQEREALLARAREKAKKESAALSRSLAAEAQEETALIKQETEALIAKLMERAQGNLEKAVEYLKMKLEFESVAKPLFDTYRFVPE
jgi:vacuolar-type H+-ATPase subunit H